jgi:hypothetical protein
VAGKEDRTAGMKSAYERALERLDEKGIERPGDLDEATRERIAEVRRKAKADLANLEILHRQQRRAQPDPHEARRSEEEYAAERRRLEERRDAAIARLRDG